KGPRKQPAHTEHIDGRTHGTIAQSILRLAETAGTVIHRNFDQAIARAFDQRRDETVHALKRNKGANAMAPPRFQSATGIAHALASKTAANKIGDAAADAFDPGVFSSGPITAHEVGAP